MQLRHLEGQPTVATAAASVTGCREYGLLTMLPIWMRRVTWAHSAWTTKVSGHKHDVGDSEADEPGQLDKPGQFRRFRQRHAGTELGLEHHHDLTIGRSHTPWSRLPPVSRYSREMVISLLVMNSSSAGWPCSVALIPRFKAATMLLGSVIRSP